MALRFFLVSAVASLGLTLPEEGQIRTWASGAQTWAYARLADWDVCLAGEAEGTDLASRPEGAKECASTQGGQAIDGAMEEMVRSCSTEGPTPEPRGGRLAVPTFEPMVIVEDLYTGMAYALNRASDGSDVSRLAAGERVATAELRSIAAAEGFSTDVAHTMSRGETGPVQGLAAKAGGRSKDGFEPMVVGDDLYIGTAYALNRTSDGLGVASEGSTFEASNDRRSEPAVASREAQLSAALRLTREAVYAWSNLLHGPAVVAISR